VRAPPPPPPKKKPLNPKPRRAAFAHKFFSQLISHHSSIQVHVFVDGLCGWCWAMGLSMTMAGPICEGFLNALLLPFQQVDAVLPAMLAAIAAAAVYALT
jgi:hypothetical protein